LQITENVNPVTITATTMCSRFGKKNLHNNVNNNEQIKKLVFKVSQGNREPEMNIRNHQRTNKLKI